MIIYHGSTVEVREPLIIESDVGRDFGAGFYTTDIKSQAERWAIRRAKFARRGGKSGTPAVVSVYEFDDAEARRRLKIKNFPGISLDWLDMVVECRTRTRYKHGFDIVTGKIANDSVGETVSYVVAGIMPKEIAMDKLRFQKINNQLAFCTEAALSCLTFKSSYVLEVPNE